MESWTLHSSATIVENSDQALLLLLLTWPDALKPDQATLDHLLRPASIHSPFLSAFALARGRWADDEIWQELERFPGEGARVGGGGEDPGSLESEPCSPGVPLTDPQLRSQPPPQLRYQLRHRGRAGYQRGLAG
ncbi:hypothetical protein CB1_001512009 [Camelus ferus]|nr:hypothetical protein CB1_001512009 [Camelus ferus]